MPRLIDANELKEWIENWFVTNAYYHPYSKSNNIPTPELYDILERMPTVDAEPVVRCKDCKFRNGERKGFCYGVERYMNDKDFCSRGERREDE